MSNSLPLSSSELIRYIELAGESDNVDAKGPMTWDSAIESAALAKDIAAFTNSRDGGVLVIGVAEPSSGSFERVGLTTEQAASFETTSVAQWFNNRFAPPTNIVCHRVKHEGLTFIVITIREFNDVPVLCTKSFQHPSDRKSHLLREHTIYVRNANAESAPLKTVDELRSLIGLATSKRGYEMLAIFESLLKGRPLLAEPGVKAQFEGELAAIENGLGQRYANQLRDGAWKLVVRPSHFDADRWPELEQLEEIIRRRSVRLRDHFPAYQRGTHPREWGICNDTYGETWTLARSGQFLCIRPYWEDHRTYECRWHDLHGDPVEPSIEPGKWLDFKTNIYCITEMLMFVVRFVEEFDPEEQVSVLLKATTLAGRTMVTTDMQVSLDASEPCRANDFEFQRSMPVEELRVEWEIICAQAMKQFVELVHGPGVSLETMQTWIERFKSRNF